MNQPHSSINSQLLLEAISIQVLETRLKTSHFPQTKKGWFRFFFLVYLQSTKMDKY